jgi:hypothetical protein
MRRLLFVLMLSCASTAQADATELRLAQLYCHEAGCTAAVDHAAIYHALNNRKRARGDETLLQTLRAYSGGLFNPRSTRTALISRLRLDGAMPLLWPEELSWDRYADGWKTALTRARRHRLHPPPNPCDGRPDHWGGLSIERDRVRAIRAVSTGRWKRLRCGTRNTFFEVRGLRLDAEQ